MDNTLSKEEYYNKYIEYFNKYNECFKNYNDLNDKFIKINDLYNLKINKQRETSYNYFCINQKNKFKHCDICNLHIKYNSYSNHLKSKKHLIAINFQNQIKELQK